MSRKKKEKKSPFFARWRRDRPGPARAVRPAGRRPLLFIAKALAVLVTFAGGAFGLYKLQQSVLAAPSYNAPARIHLVDVPKDIEEQMAGAMRPFADTPWTDDHLCEQIAASLTATGWVDRVLRVQRFADRRIEVHCRYRTPLALVQMGSGFYLVDDHGVRLPGRYVNDPAFMLIQGVSTTPPSAGCLWDAPDLRAAVRLVKLLINEPFATQITAVQVHNFAGRVDPREGHIRLATNQPGSQIVWGSPVGEEIEENTAEQKLAILRANYHRFGRIDADRRLIDISVHPDRVNAPA